MRTSVLPLVDIVRGSWLLADKSVDTALTSITDVFNFYSRDLVVDSRHALMIWETGAVLNYSTLKLRSSMKIGSKVPIRDIVTPASIESLRQQREAALCKRVFTSFLQ